MRRCLSIFGTQRPLSIFNLWEPHLYRVSMIRSSSNMPDISGGTSRGLTVLYVPKRESISSLDRFFQNFGVLSHIVNRSKKLFFLVFSVRKSGRQRQDGQKLRNFYTRFVNLQSFDILSLIMTVFSKLRGFITHRKQNQKNIFPRIFSTQMRALQAGWPKIAELLYQIRKSSKFYHYKHNYDRFSKISALYRTS